MSQHFNNQIPKPRARQTDSGWMVYCRKTGITVFNPFYDDAVSFYYTCAAIDSGDRREWRK